MIVFPLDEGMLDGKDIDEEGIVRVPCIVWSLW